LWKGRSSNQIALNRPVFSFGKCFVCYSELKMEFYGKMNPKHPKQAGRVLPEKDIRG
jgi:hypothetical protein